MRSCPSDPEETREGLPLTQPMMGWEGVVSKVSQILHVTMMLQHHSFIVEEDAARFIQVEFDADAEVNVALLWT